MKRAPESESVNRWLWAVSGSAKAGIAVLTLLRSAVSVLAVVFALELREVIDAAAAQETEAFIRAFLILAVIILLQLLANAVIRRLGEGLKAELENRMKQRTYSTILSRAFSALAAFHTGELLNRMTSDTAVAAEGMVSILPETVAMLVKIAGAAAVLVALDWRFAVILLAGGVCLMAVSYGFRKIMKRMHKQVQEADGQVRSFLQETVENLLILRACSSEAQAAEQAEQRMRKHKAVRLQRNRFSNLCNTGFGAVMNAGYLFGLVWCGFGIIEGTISYGTLTAVLQLIGQIETPFANMTGYIPRYYSMLASAERLMELEQLPGEDAVPQLSAAERDALYDRLESVELQDVCFTYPGKRDAPPVLQQASVLIRKGTFAAITGRSGIGKSTLLKLLLSVYTPDRGTLQLNLRQADPLPVSPYTRPLFAYVPQGNFVLSGSIQEAVSFMRDADPARVRAACRIACAEFIEQLPQRYDTVLGEKGAGLSEGQIQRIAIARAIYSGAPVLLLDEATSALDAETEARLLQNLRNLTSRTVLIVTHRPAALAVCDVVLRIQDGSIAMEKSMQDVLDRDADLIV